MYNTHLSKWFGNLKTRIFDFHLHLNWYDFSLFFSFLVNFTFAIAMATIKEHTMAGLNNSIGPIARNCPKWPSGNRICGLKLPAKLVFWQFGQQAFCCVKQLLTAHPIRSCFWEVICEVTVKFNQFLFVISMISSPLFSIWLYNHRP